MFFAEVVWATVREMDMDEVSINIDPGGPTTVTAVATTRVFRFKDDFTATIKDDGDAVVIDVRSKSRIGKGDLGANARRIREFQQRLAAKLQG